MWSLMRVQRSSGFPSDHLVGPIVSSQAVLLVLWEVLVVVGEVLTSHEGCLRRRGGEAVLQVNTKQ